MSKLSDASAAAPDALPGSATSPAHDPPAARMERAGDRPRLRVGLIIASDRQPAWVHRTISDVIASGVAEIAVVIVMPAGKPGAAGHNVTSQAVRTHRAFELYRDFDRYWFSDDRPDPFVDVDIAPLIAYLPRIVIGTTGAASPTSTVDAELACLRAYQLDVALRFGAPRPPFAAAEYTRSGVWSYVGDSDGDPLRDPAAPGYREVLTGSPVTRSALQLDGTGESPARVIYESYASTAALSAWKNRRELYWKTAAFVPRKLRELADVGAETFGARVDLTRPDPAPHRPPGNAEMLLSLPRLAARYAATQIAMRTSLDQWFVAYRFHPAETSGVPDTNLRDFVRLSPPKDRMWADPFPIVHEGRHLVFVEELLYARNKGHISVMEVDERNGATRPELVLETENHLSYPFLLKWKGETFMIPESARAGDNPADAGSRSVPVFRARRFPFDWVQETVILEGLEVFDPTLAEIDGVWWLFCTQAEPGASTWDELHLFHGPTPFGPWTPHRRNPVKSDVRSARPAGRPYQQGGMWYRPAQNCSVRYGYGLSINRIDRLTPTEYRETEVMSILPDWAPGLIGTHTLNAAGRLSVTDGRLRRSRWSSDAPPLRTRPSGP